MKLYESVFIARSELSPAQVEAVAEKLAHSVKQFGAEVAKVEYCGLRQLAYPINKSNKGHYVIMNISASTDIVKAGLIKELDRQLRLNEDVVRFLNVTVEAHETGSSLLAQQARIPRESGFDTKRRV